MRIRPLVMEIGVATVLVLVRTLQACSRKKETPAVSDASPQPFPPFSWTAVHAPPLTTADYVATRNCARAVDLPGDSGGATGLWSRLTARGPDSLRHYQPVDLGDAPGGSDPGTRARRSSGCRTAS